ncbi:hypothetical protein B0O80DRAFT_436349 [Mortierella sp. GBAus27b]|nr:hypothetical protein B0O80DRAFT_436349 [Mortierella sp. GBAus27b]
MTCDTSSNSNSNNSTGPLGLAGPQSISDTVTTSSPVSLICSPESPALHHDADGYSYTDKVLSHPRPSSTRLGAPSGASNQPATTSMFDQYKAEMERLRSPARTSSSSSSFSAASSTSNATTLLPSSITSGPITAEPLSIGETGKLAMPTPCVNIKKSNFLVSKLLGKRRMGTSKKMAIPSHQQPSSSSLPHQDAPTTLTPDSLSSPLVLEKTASIGVSGVTCTTDATRLSLEEQHDRWREEWLRRSGAIHSMFRDRPSKFNCPHCGATKVVSHIQFVPGVMSYLVAFGLVFLTLGTLSYLPLRKGHEGTKDCVHWCPECGQKVARFLRANATWEWI